MANMVDYETMDNWTEFIVSELKNSKITNKKNPFYNENFLYDFRDLILDVVKKELEMVGSSDDDWFNMYNNYSWYLLKNNPLEIIYLDSFSKNESIILAYIRRELGMSAQDPIPLEQKKFISGLKELLENSHPGFINYLKDYLLGSSQFVIELKSYLGIPAEDTTFDSELSILCKSGYQRLIEMISSDEKEIYDLVTYISTRIFDDDPILFANMFAVGKEWLYLYVKLSFDPPTASTLTYLKERLNELERYIVNYNLGDLIYGEQKHAGDKTSWD